jgi:hypothetical protein
MSSPLPLDVSPRRLPSSDLLDRLERQAKRIGQLEAELAQARAQLLALPSPADIDMATYIRPPMANTARLATGSPFHWTEKNRRRTLSASGMGTPSRHSIVRAKRDTSVQ